MIDVKNIRKDFPQLAPNGKGESVIYLDSAATSLKPIQVIRKINEYYIEYCGNAHSQDHNLAIKVTDEVEKSRENIARFINSAPNEIIFTSGDTMGMNFLAYALLDKLNDGDEILISLVEHASNILPWYKIMKIKNIKVRFIPLNEDGSFNFEKYEECFNEHTKIVSLAHTSNVLGYTLDMKKIASIAHKHNCLVISDAAQVIAHTKVDVKDLDIDFMVFSGHKMLGPTGIGVVYGKYKLLEELDPPFVGGGMNGRFDTEGHYNLVKIPHRFEAGTQNFAGIVGLGRAVQYLSDIGMDNIKEYEMELKKYAISKLKLIPGITIYNEESNSGIIAFNLDKVFAQDAATFFNSYGVCVRSGQHCAKVLENQIHTYATVRVSFYFYNTFEEIDKFIEVCKKGDEYLDVYFK